MSAYPPSETPQRRPAGTLIDLPPAESARLLNKATCDYTDAWSDNDRRIARFRRHFRSWRSKIGMVGGLQGRANYRVPLIVEKTLIKWAKTLDSLLGDDAEIVALPTGPVDRTVAEKVGRYMTWQVFNHMDITEELAKFIFQEIIFGRAHAELYYDLRWLYGPGDKKQLLYDGPCFRTLPMDCFITHPTAGETSPHQLRWYCTREWKTLDQLLADEREGYCKNITKYASEIWQQSQQAERYDETTDRLRKEQADFEGVISDYAATTSDTVEVRKHYLGWRMLKGGDAEYDNFDRRSLYETQLCVQYIPDVNIRGMASAGLEIGTRDMAEVYPNSPYRRPIASASLFKDGSYWPPSLPELLEDTEIEKSVNHNLMNEAGERAVSPPVFYVPGMGLSEEKHILEPGMAYPSADPRAVNVINMQADYQFCVVRDQMLTAIAEGVSGLPASSVGRSPETPNQPRTFRGQALLEQGSNIRQQLEMIFMSEDWSKILDQIKMLVDEYGPEEEEFRVTEESQSGYFASKGFSTITARERQGKYDFKLKFATSAQSREARKERALAFLQAAAPLPLFIQNPNLQRDWLKVMAKELQLEGLLPALGAVPDTNVPMDPETEWVQALQGIRPMISIADDDNKHIESHMGHLQEQQKIPPDEQDEDAQMKMIAHVMEHKEQLRTKMEMMAQAKAQAAAQAVTGMLGQAAGGPSPEDIQGQQLAGGALAQLMGGGAVPMGPADMSGGFAGDMSAAEQGGY